MARLIKRNVISGLQIKTLAWITLVIFSFLFGLNLSHLHDVDSLDKVQLRPIPRTRLFGDSSVDKPSYYEILRSQREGDITEPGMMTMSNGEVNYDPHQPIRIIAIQSDPSHYWCSCAQDISQKYADKHGYKLHWVTSASEEETPSDAKMSKYSHVLKYFDKSSLILLMDCDIFITNPEITVEQIWEENSFPSTGIIVSRDAESTRGVPVNSGMVLIRPCQFSKLFLNSILEKGRWAEEGGGYKILENVGLGGTGRYNSKTLVDQPRLTVELERLGQLSAPETFPLDSNLKNLNEYHEFATIVSQRVMNSFYRKGYKHDSPESVWREGDFTAHITGMKTKDRVDGAQRFGDGCPGVVDLTDGIVLTTDGVHNV